MKAGPSGYGRGAAKGRKLRPRARARRPERGPAERPGTGHRNDTSVGG